MKRMDLQTAKKYLTESVQMNPGLWGAHSEYVSLAAKLIAPHVGLDPERAEVYGLIHDIGRRFGVTNDRHATDGYKFLLDEGYPEEAAICITHSSPTLSHDDFVGVSDCPPDDLEFWNTFTANHNFTLMDKLIILCDALALTTGFTTVERRIVDVALRYGFNEQTLARWRAFFNIQKEFEDIIGKSIYSLLPGIQENILNKKLSETWKI